MSYLCSSVKNLRRHLHRFPVNGRVYVGVSSNQEYAATVAPHFQVDFSRLGCRVR